MGQSSCCSSGGGDANVQEVQADAPPPDSSLITGCSPNEAPPIPTSTGNTVTMPMCTADSGGCTEDRGGAGIAESVAEIERWSRQALPEAGEIESQRREWLASEATTATPQGSTSKSKAAREAERVAKEHGRDGIGRSFKNDALDPDLFNTVGTLGSVGGSKDNLFNTLSSTQTASPFTTTDYKEMGKEQRHEAKQVIKEFVKTMVRGRHFPVVAASGELRTCFCTLSRKLDRLKISIDANDKRVREVPLKTISEVLYGGDGRAEQEAGLWGKTDKELSEDVLVTLVLFTDQCITFKMPTTEERDNIAACLSLLSGQAKNE